MVLIGIQLRLLMTMGPMTQLWKILEDVRMGTPDDGHASIEVVDFRQIWDLIEKTICCIG